MAQRRYVVLDVFTTRPLEGNPLAVVLDSEGLDTAAMQRIAGEFNLSETVFVTPAENPAHSAAVRIFTPGRELPFAGHPTVGTACCLAARRFPDLETEMDAVVALEEQIGLVRCAVRLVPGAAAYAEFDVPRLSEMGEASFGPKSAIADALGLKPHEIGFENHVSTVWSAGNPFAFVPVAGLAAMRRIKVAPQHWTEAFGPATPGIYVYCRETLFHDSSFHGRMFAPGLGVGEDPATGSAIAAFAGLVNDFDDLPNGTFTYRIEQGFEMGRPSLIDLEIEVEAGELTAARIGGHAVKVAEGVLEV
ncbi:PhzF family phenazine biosynthesis protein [Prosthecomicrobium sp. N25]|uniref:PhzF family phenazine biosynthesis protein n=1 Tax=Prosthecomicrobium sp. N25 TaxID=3129254 RepID=UPI0030771BC1